MATKNHSSLIEHGQGVLLPPTDIPGGDELLIVPGPEGGFFQDPEVADRVTRLTYESKALKNFASACEAKGSIEHTDNIQAGFVDFDDDILEPVLRRAVSVETRKRVADLVPKINFARSIGIEPEKLMSKDPVTDEFLPETLRVEAKDRNDRADLNREYRIFKQTYAGAHNAEARDARRAEIKNNIRALQVGILATHSS